MGLHQDTRGRSVQTRRSFPYQTRPSKVHQHRGWLVVCISVVHLKDAQNHIQRWIVVTLASRACPWKKLHEHRRNQLAWLELLACHSLLHLRLLCRQWSRIRVHSLEALLVCFILPWFYSKIFGYSLCGKISKSRSGKGPIFACHSQVSRRERGGLTALSHLVSGHKFKYGG